VEIIEEFHSQNHETELIVIDVQSAAMSASVVEHVVHPQHEVIVGAHLLQKLSHFLRILMISDPYQQMVDTLQHAPDVSVQKLIVHFELKHGHNVTYRIVDQILLLRQNATINIIAIVEAMDDWRHIFQELFHFA